MKLTQFEAETAVWKKVESALTDRMNTLRMKNDGALEPLETARLRGSIAMIKEILSWTANSPTIN